MNTKPFIMHYYIGEYPAKNDARLHIDKNTMKVVNVEYPEPDTDPNENWANQFVGMSFDEVEEYAKANYEAYMLMKDCW